ncbi:MAG: hypothetical protein IPQ16_14840 [Geobacteraceae bacterium]|nr:hypothetical protein [Geobacteraceae bacterium]
MTFQQHGCSDGMDGDKELAEDVLPGLPVQRFLDFKMVCPWSAKTGKDLEERVNC